MTQHLFHIFRVVNISLFTHILTSYLGFLLDNVGIYDLSVEEQVVFLNIRPEIEAIDPHLNNIRTKNLVPKPIDLNIFEQTW